MRETRAGLNRIRGVSPVRKVDGSDVSGALPRVTVIEGWYGPLATIG